MQARLELKSVRDVDADAVVVFAFEGQPPALAPAALTEELYSSAEFQGKSCQTALLYRPEGWRAKRLLLIGCGKPEEFDGHALRAAAGRAARLLKERRVSHVAFAAEQPWRSAETVSALVEATLLGAYDPDLYKTDPEKKGTPLGSVTVIAEGAGEELQAAVERGSILAECQNFARDLVSEPANRLTPGKLAERARAMAEQEGLSCEIIDESRLKQLGMGALLGVAQGSEEPPALIVLRYSPETESTDHLGLVGKGITFDTGGISLKPSEHMDEMKFDMAGGAAVLGAMRAIARLKPSIAVTAFVPAVENMPGGKAQRPGDIVTTLSGKTVEVMNTDAEGRLIMADTFTYAQKLGCTHLVDAATLTGAIVVALGHVYTGAFTNDQEMLNRLLEAGKAEGEKIWHMPLDEDYAEQLKSPYADLPNIGKRWGGAITAAYFLKQFADPVPWVHLDIAGTAWTEEAKPHMAKGPTGVGVRTLARLAADWQS